MSAWVDTMISLETVVGVHLAILLVLLARGPVARRLGAGWAYALWLLPVARIVLPPLPMFADFSLANLAAPTPIVTAVAVAPEAGIIAAPESGIDGTTVLLAIWGIGTVLFLLWQAAAYGRLSRAITASGQRAAPFEGLETIESPATASPLALGFLHPRIVLPSDFSSRFTRTEQRFALEHEAIHLRRGDLWWNLVALVILALNWFSPLAHLAFRAFRLDQELACDAAVAARIGPSARHDYATALVKSASHPGLIAACPLNDADQLKRRLKMMKTHGGGRTRAFGGGIAAAGFLILGLGLSGAHAAPQEAASPSKPEARPGLVIIEHKEKHAEKVAGPAESTPKQERKIEVRTVGAKEFEGPEVRIKSGKVEIDGKSPQDLAEQCAASGSSSTEGGSADGRTFTRVRVCTTDGKTPSAEQMAEAVERLEALKARFNDDRSEIAAALDRAIARINEGQ